MENRKSAFNNKIALFILLFIMTVCLSGCGAISDGEYAASVSLSGGSGRAYIESPCTVTVSGGKATAQITWSSPNYDYMIVDGKTYYPVNEEGNSTFIIPVVLNKKMEISADTVAMSTPHLIDYTVIFSVQDIEDGDSAQTAQGNSGQTLNFDEALEPPEIAGLSYLGTDENDSARCFKIHRYSGGYSIISIYDGRKYLIIPEGGDVPEGITTGSSASGNANKSAGDIILLRQPLDSIYLASSNNMCHFDSLGAIPHLILSGIDKDGWFIDAARNAMEEGRLEYGGKYSAPDYEKIIEKGVDLAIENTMILHTPKVQEKLESLGIPVFVDRSNYEEEPLGRCEWIRVYGLLTGKEEEAAKAYSEQASLIDALGRFEDSSKSVVVFSINANHVVYTKKSNDYFAKMIEMAGGRYLAPVGSENTGASTQTSVTMEAFYDYAAGADMLIYNSTIEDAPASINALVSTDPLFADFKAVRDGNVWCADKSMYQFANQTGTIIDELSRIISSKDRETQFFHKLP